MLKDKPRVTIPARPRPPKALSAQADLPQPGLFLPAPDVVAWIMANFVSVTGPLYSPGHAHLAHAHVGALWTNCSNTRQMRRILAQAEMPFLRGGAWQKGRVEQQMREWFGDVPDFVLTFDAEHAAECSDIEFCALVDHELCHCAQALDEYGCPKFTKEGVPKFAIRGHDVEEFVSVVRRFGVAAAGDSAVDFVIAAGQSPEIGAAPIALACGTCGR